MKGNVIYIIQDNKTAYDVAKNDEIRSIIREALDKVYTSHDIYLMKPQLNECVCASAGGDISAVEKLLLSAPHFINWMNNVIVSPSSL